MKLDHLYEVFEILATCAEDTADKKRAIQLRKIVLSSFVSNKNFTKLAFDTRRIDQETEINPRRGLQNYNRSESFLSEAMGEKLRNFAKLKNVLNSLKNRYGKEPEWQDSNARILLSTLEKGLRSDYHDGDYTEAQPGTGSLDYIEELLHVRYRLDFNNLQKMAEDDLKRVILSKDEELVNKNVNQVLGITKQDISHKSYDTLMEQLFSGARATKENKSVERTITITIRDTLLDEK